MAENRVSHLPVEVLESGEANALLSHVPVEILGQYWTITRVSHVAVEVLARLGGNAPKIFQYRQRRV